MHTLESGRKNGGEGIWGLVWGQFPPLHNNVSLGPVIGPVIVAASRIPLPAN